MNFHNRENKCYKTEDGDVWNSRSIAVVGLVLMLHEGEKYVLLTKRGKSSPNEVGKYCMPCGYLDWNETCEEAVVREIWEETGFNVYKALDHYNVIYDHMYYPWRINSSPYTPLQNVSMHYAVYFDTQANAFRDVALLPDVTFENNKEEGEVEEVRWVNVNDLVSYDCAFGHDTVIKIFVNSLPVDEERP